MSHSFYSVCTSLMLREKVFEAVGLLVCREFIPTGFNVGMQFPNSQIDLCTPRAQSYLWSLESLKVEWKPEPSVNKPVSHGIIFQSESRGQTPSLPLRMGLKLSFWLSPAHRYVSIGLTVLGNSHDALSYSLLLFLSSCLHSCPITNTWNYHLPWRPCAFSSHRFLWTVGIHMIYLAHSSSTVI